LGEMGKVNIALLSIHSCPYAVLGGKDTGGMNVYIRESCRELLDRGHRIDIYTASHVCGHCSLMQPGVEMKLVHLDNTLSAHAELPDFRQQVSALAAEIDHAQDNSGYKYDLIHSHYWQSGIVGLELQKKWNVPHITMFHTLSRVKKLFNVANTDPLLRAEMEQEIAAGVDRVVASTLREKGYLQQLYGANGSRISVIPCGVNPGVFMPRDRLASRQKLGLSESENLVLFVGRLEPLKGIDRLLKGYALLKDSIPARILILGGDESNNDYRVYLESLASGLGIREKVNFAGSVPQDELSYYYSAADLSVVPSYYESFCLVIPESLACGTPVITSDIGAARQIIKNAAMGSVLDDNTPEMIAGKIAEYLRPERKREVFQAGAAIAEYNWDNICNQLGAEYSALVGSQQLCETRS
jgi:D-inositol-3-phosphate glycosyltransferase